MTNSVKDVFLARPSFDRLTPLDVEMYLALKNTKCFRGGLYVTHTRRHQRCYGHDIVAVAVPALARAV